jgi:hypothetical protein
LASSSKKPRGVKPRLPAKNTAGMDWIAALNSATALLKKRRAAAIFVSSADSSPCSERKFWLALRSG